MKLSGIIWLRDIVDKLLSKHNVTTDEAEEVLNQDPRIRFIEKGDVEGEHLYAAMGKTHGGRYLIVYFVHKASGDALVISAREMLKKERNAYAKK